MSSGDHFSATRAVYLFVYIVYGSVCGENCAEFVIVVVVIFISNFYGNNGQVEESSGKERWKEKENAKVEALIECD